MMEQVRKLLIPFVFALTRQRSYDPSIRVAARHSSYLRRARDDQSASLFTPGALVSPDPHVPQRVARRTQPIGQGQYPTSPRSMDAHRGRLPADSWESAAKHGGRGGNRYFPVAHCNRRGSRRNELPRSAASSVSHRTCRAQCVPSNWCCSENSQTPTMLAGTMTASSTAATGPTPSIAARAP